jgi:Arc/MetJ-type ribon-helix-helix transcriptional regulator
MRPMAEDPPMVRPMSEPASDGQRLTVRLPPTLCADLDTLVEDGQFRNKSDAVRAALRLFTQTSDVNTMPTEREPTTEMEGTNG